jgi:hypothetical protein
MKTFLLVAASELLIIIGMSGCTSGYRETPRPTPQADHHDPEAQPKPRRVMQAFGSEQELRSYFKELAQKQNLRQRMAATKLAAPAMSVAGSASEAMDARADESVTNVQHAGVDEGGIVKLHGNHLVILRRGRLFTVSLHEGELVPVSSINAFGPEIDPRSTWYDEMLVSDDTIAVIGYSYERGGTEVGLFQIDQEGKLSYRSTYHLRSNDYYSSRNYASRLIGNKLIFYSPLYIYPGAEDPFGSFPAVRKWHIGATNGEFRRIVSATRVYRPEHAIDASYGMALHTVTVCDLAGGGFDCKATSVIGPPGRVFYVSPNSVYVWVTEWIYRGQTTQTESMLYRMPLDGSEPSALRVSGSPVDQFSFLESEDDHLNVLVRSEAPGDGMWGAEVAAGDVALMRVPLASFSDGSASVEPSNYRRIPTPAGYTFQNRFVGEYLLYGTGSGWGYASAKPRSSLFAVRWANGQTRGLPLAHGVDRIEQMGSDAVVVGTDGKDLHFTSVRLGNSATVADEYVRKDASQGELRSQGFFYKPNGKDSGMLGLPISVAGRPGYRHLFENSAAILFLKNSALHFDEVGELGAKPDLAKNDGCRASCVDWYGNARPLFVRGRLIALLGYELVEGTISDDGHIQEMRRVNYAPRGSAVEQSKVEDE